MARPLRIGFGLPDSRGHLPSTHWVTEFIHPDVVLHNVSRKFDVGIQRLTNPSEDSLEARNVAMWIVSELCGLKLQEIGRLFGGLDYAAIARRIRRTRRSYSEETSRDLIREMSHF